MAFLKGNLHAHTTFSDGVRSPQALIAEYESRGYDFLAITDHEDHENWVEPAYQRTLERLAPRLLLFRGIEVNFDPLEQHVGKVYGDTETLWVLNHPARYRLSVAETVARVDMIRAAGWPLDAIEVPASSALVSRSASATRRSRCSATAPGAWTARCEKGRVS